MDKGIINQERLIPGAGEFFIWPSLGSFARVGAYRDASIESRRESSELVFNNDKVNKYKKGREFGFKFKLGEIDPDLIYEMNKWWIERTSIAGTAVTGGTATLDGTAGTYEYERAIELPVQNHDLSLVTVSAISGSVDGSIDAGLFVVKKGSNGKSVVIFSSGAGITTLAQVFTLTVDYTPAQSIKLNFIETGVATKFFAKFIHERPDGKQILITLEDVQNLSPLTIEFVGNEDDDVATIEVELVGKVMDQGFEYEV